LRTRNLGQDETSSWGKTFVAHRGLSAETERRGNKNEEEEKGREKRQKTEDTPGRL